MTWWTSLFRPPQPFNKPMSKLSDPQLKFIISSGVISASMDFIRSQGARGHEGVVLWAGRLLQNGACGITEPIIPKQITDKRFYRIPTEETFRIIEMVATAGMVIPIQLHSHPCEAFHSEADDELAFASTLTRYPSSCRTSATSLIGISCNTLFSTASRKATIGR